MTSISRSIRNFVRADDGATTAEYGIIIVVVAGIAVAALSTFGGSLTSLYNRISDRVNNAN
jgi:Flp pilus assembly pilin Flp